MKGQRSRRAHQAPERCRARGCPSSRLGLTGRCLATSLLANHRTSLYGRGLLFHRGHEDLFNRHTADHESVPAVCQCDGGRPRAPPQRAFSSRFPFWARAGSLAGAARRGYSSTEFGNSSSKRFGKEKGSVAGGRVPVAVTQPKGQRNAKFSVSRMLNRLWSSSYYTRRRNAGSLDF